MNIGIIGAGNIGTATAADLSRNNNVKLFSTKPYLFAEEIHYNDYENNEFFDVKIQLVSDRYEDVLNNIEILFIAQPTMIIKETVLEIVNLIEPGTLVGFIPGAGGLEYLSKPLLDKGITIFGFERTPYVSRLIEYGKSVDASKKSVYRIASLPAPKCSYVTKLISKLFDREVRPLKNFISISLTPSLHASRLYELYKEYKTGQLLYDNPLFYGDWTDEASEICLELDKELHLVCDNLIEIGIDASEVVPYPIHYESETPQALTEKLRTIKSLHNIRGPVIERTPNCFYLDLASRYFTESYPCRLCVVKGIADLLSVKVPITTKLIKWYQTLIGKEYVVNGIIEGYDAKDCIIPQNYGIHCINELLDYYKNINDGK